jgi:hypothetical protein
MWTRNFASSVFEGIQEHSKCHNSFFRAKCRGYQEKTKVVKVKINQEREDKRIQVSAEICRPQKIILQVRRSQMNLILYKSFKGKYSCDE